MSILLLDIGNVVLEFDFSIFSKKLSFENKDKELFIFNKYCTGIYKDKLDRGALSSSNFFKMIADDTGKDIPTIKKYWEEIFSEVEGVKKSLDEIKKYYSTWIVSDTDPVHFDYFLQNYHVVSQFDKYYTSFSIGVLKSNSEFFRHILRSNELDPSNYILLDDKVENCESANFIGIESILFKSWSDTLKKLTNRSG